MVTEKTTLLSSVCEIVMGQAPDGSSYNTHSNGYPLIAGAGDFGALFPNPGKFTDTPTKLSHDGDIILCIRATIGDRNWSDTCYCLGRGVAGLRAKNGKLFQGYLWHWLGHTAPELKAKGRGATFLQVSKSDIGSLLIPLPPIEEQKRIAAILDEADALRVKRRESIAQLEALLQSTFLDMFGDPVTNPMGWEVVSMQSIAGGSFRNGISASTTGSIQGQVLTLSAITSGKYDDTCCKHVNFDRVPQINQLVTEDAFLICRGNGNKKMVGIGAFPRNCRGRVVFPDTIIASTPDLSRIERAYLQFVWASRKVREQIESGARTTNGTYKINQGMLNSVTFPLPPLSLQRRFSSIVEAAERQKARLRAHLDELDALFASLQSRAFNGEL